MFTGLFLLFAFFVLFYSYETYPSQFSATASAIRQVWSGNCRLSCRPREPSVTSDLSDLNQFTYHGNDSCVCESCPCQLVENVLRRCSPFTNMYSTIMYSLFTGLSAIFNTIYQFTACVFSLVHCRFVCQRRYKITLDETPSVESVTNIDNDTKNVLQSPPVNTKRSILKLIGSKTSLKGTEKVPIIKDNDIRALAPDAGSSQEKPKAVHVSSSETLTSSKTKKGCFKCVEKGITCMNQCPRENKSKMDTKGKYETVKDEVTKCCGSGGSCASGCPKVKSGQGNDRETNLDRFINMSNEIVLPEEYKKYINCFRKSCVSGCSKSKITSPSENAPKFGANNLKPEFTPTAEKETENSPCSLCKVNRKMCLVTCPKKQETSKNVTLKPTDETEIKREINPTPEDNKKSFCSKCTSMGKECLAACPQRRAHLNNEESANTSKSKPSGLKADAFIEKVHRQPQKDEKKNEYEKSLNINYCLECSSKETNCKRSCPNFDRNMNC